MRTQSDGILHFNDDEHVSLSGIVYLRHCRECCTQLKSSLSVYEYGGAYLPAPNGLRTVYEASPYLAALERAGYKRVLLIMTNHKIELNEYPP